MNAKPIHHACTLWRKALLLIAILPLLCFEGNVRAQDVRPKDYSVYNEALSLYNKRQYTVAAKSLRNIASRNPRSSDVQFWLGMTAVKDGFNVSGIRRYFTKCIELNPSYPHPLAHYYMGIIHYTDDRFADAVSELNLFFSLSRDMNDKDVNKVYNDASNYLYWATFLADAELHRVPFAPRRVQGVSSKYNELYPFLAADGKTMYYLRQVPERQAPTYYQQMQTRYEWQLFESRWQDTTFSKGMPMGKPFNSGASEGGVSITADGCELYYSIIKPVGNYANSDIYCVRRVDGVWQQPEALGPQVNGDHSWESQPTVSADGRTLIFASNRSGGQGGIDLWRCHRLSNGDWSRAENLGTSVNTPGNEKTPFLAADGHTLYFLSDGWQGFGGYDIFFADLLETQTLRPTNLGLPLNTESDEMSFAVTLDGKQAYCSVRPEGANNSDVLMFDLYEQARPEPMSIVRLSVRSPHGKHDTTLVLHTNLRQAICLFEDSTLPYIAVGSADQLRRLSPGLNDSVSSIDLSDTASLNSLFGWLVDHPREHIVIESPHSDQSRGAYTYLRQKGIRAERLTHRGGTEFSTPQIRRNPTNR